MRHCTSMLIAACLALPVAPGECEGVMFAPYNNSADAADCMEAFNAARAAAGLEPFNKVSTTMLNKPLDELYKHCDLACTALEPGRFPSYQFNISGTIMFSPQEGKDGDCKAAVDFMKKGHRYFTSLPPAYHRSGKPPYDKFQTVGFVGLYNPQKDADVDCAYFTCYQFEEMEDVPRSVHRGFMCVTNPPALQPGEFPFTKEQFQKIRESIYDAQDADGQAAERDTMSIFGMRN
ncbi:hypothetical protein Emed_005422 [Eimeria media]